MPVDGVSISASMPKLIFAFPCDSLTNQHFAPRKLKSLGLDVCFLGGFFEAWWYDFAVNTNIAI